MRAADAKILDSTRECLHQSTKQRPMLRHNRPLLSALGHLPFCGLACHPSAMLLRSFANDCACSPAAILDLLHFTKTSAVTEAANHLNLTANMHRWKLSALAAAAFVSTALSTTDAAALTLGPISIQSALGENLRAEIAIPQITPAELDSLLASVAPPDVFRAQGMDYSTAADSIAVALQRNADGTAKLQLTSSTPITTPFLDLVLQTNWNSGQMVRSYTLLLDLPASTRPATAPIAPAQITPTPAPAPAITATPAMPSAAVTGRSYSSSAAPSTVTARARAAASAGTAPQPASASQVQKASAAETLTIRSGQTAGHIANARRASGVSLDQMLVAMLRSNPKAFINGNVNRMRAGAVVQMPSREQALEIPAQEARRIVAAQSRDFNAYRRSLASKAPAAAVQAASRSSGGQVQARVEDARPAATTPDKLTLSKGSAQSAAVAEQQLADQKQAQDQSDRLNELQRNLTELNQLAQSSPAETAPAATPAADAAAPAPLPETAEPPASAAPSIEVATSAPTPAETAVPENTAVTPAPATTTPEDDAPAKSAATQAAPTTVAEPSFMERLSKNPLIPAGGAAIALLLALLGYGAWKKRHPDNAEQDPVLSDRHSQHDDFFGAAGDQPVDAEPTDGASTMAYVPGPLNEDGEADPVAEADVHLAYGRDVQAEEILKEGLRNNPERLAVHMKLAEIYAKRHDLKALESTARTVQDLSPSDGTDWQRVVALGRSLDPTNPLYAAASADDAAKPQTSFADALNNAAPFGTAAAGIASAAAITAAITEPATQKFPDLDLNLDQDLPGEQASTHVEPSFDSSTSALSQEPPEDNLAIDNSHAAATDGLDFDLSGVDAPPIPTAPEKTAETPVPQPELQEELDQQGDEAPAFDVETPAPPPPESVTPPPAAAPTPAAPEPFSDPEIGLDFDLGSLETGSGSAGSAAAPEQSGQNDAENALSTKLDLAQEFNAIGDSEGARALIEEVLAEATGPHQARAQKMLSELD